MEKKGKLLRTAKAQLAPCFSFLFQFVL